MRIITLIAIIGVGIVYSNTVAYAENSKTPNHIVCFLFGLRKFCLN